jgi:hypothetical protein
MDGDEIRFVESGAAGRPVWSTSHSLITVAAIAEAIQERPAG